VSFQRYMIGWVYDMGWLLVHICNPATVLSTRCIAQPWHGCVPGVGTTSLCLVTARPCTDSECRLHLSECISAVSPHATGW
jgi:hypothetical protein